MYKLVFLASFVTFAEAKILFVENYMLKAVETFSGPILYIVCNDAGH